MDLKPAVQEANGRSRDDSLSPGTIVGGKYKIQAALGAGGMGKVYFAMHLKLNQPVAIKVLASVHSLDAAHVARFLHEARAAARIQHENVVRIVDVDEIESGQPYIVMEYLKGRDLSALLRKYGPMPLETAVSYVLQACEGLASAHALQIVHRDIKPANLFLTHRPDGTSLIKVVDFGISKSVEEEDAQLTHTTTIVGSPSFMSPEQIQSSKYVDHRSDIWSLGVTLYQLVSCQLPFGSGTPTAMAVRIAQQPPIPLSAVLKNTPPALEAIMDRCLQKDVNRRFQQMSELAEALAKLIPNDTGIQERLERMSRMRMQADPVVIPMAAVSVPPYERVTMSIESNELVTASSFETPKPVKQVQAPRKSKANVLVVAASLLTVLLMGFAGTHSWIRKPTLVTVARVGIRDEVSMRNINEWIQNHKPETIQAVPEPPASAASAAVTPESPPTQKHKAKDSHKDPLDLGLK